jgi:hypothetical protein
MTFEKFQKMVVKSIAANLGVDVPIEDIEFTCRLPGVVKESQVSISFTSQPPELSTAQRITRDVFAKLEPLNALSESVTNNVANREAITGVIEATIQAVLDESRTDTPKVLTDALNRVTSVSEDNATLRGELSNQMEHIEQLRDYANQLELAGDNLYHYLTILYREGGTNDSYDQMAAWQEARNNAI